MRAFLLIALLGSSSALLAQQPNTPPAASDQITVTGERIRDLEAALRACLARRCPPNEDVDASLALAEGHFLNGDYDDAEEAIGGSIGRNRRHSRQYPEPVADLFRSQARVQSHRGRDRQAALSTYDILRTLRTGIPQEDHRHFTARLEIIQMEMRAGNRNGAQRELRELIASAQRAGRDDVARLAQMRELQLAYLIASETAPNGPALRRLEALAASTDPDQRFESVSSRLFLARIYRERGDTERSDAMLAGVPPSDSDRRQLLYAPSYRLAEGQYWDSSEASGSTTRRLPDNYHNKWIDVGYWIEADGRVSGLEVVREGASSGWARPVLDSIRGRIYAASADRTPSYRLERYTYAAPFEVGTGSRMPQRSRRARAEYMDLTNPGEPGRAPDTRVAPGQDS